MRPDYLWSPTALAYSAEVVSATKAGQPWPLPQRFVGRNPPTRRPKPMGGVPKGILLRQGYGAYPHSSPPSRAGLFRFAEEGKMKKPLINQGLKSGAGDGGRTHDLMLGKHTL